MLPKTLGGLFGFVITALIMVIIGLWIINRAPMLQQFIAPRQ